MTLYINRSKPIFSFHYFYIYIYAVIEFHITVQSNEKIVSVRVDMCVQGQGAKLCTYLEE
jgi:hypothetical protein